MESLTPVVWQHEEEPINEKEVIMEDKEYFAEYFNFSCILRGKVKYLEHIKDYIIREYVEKGH